VLFSPHVFSEDIIKTTTDPSYIGIGARPIGMGKAYVGLADDISSIYMNPAGLAGLKTYQLMSMTTRLLNEIDYLSFAGTYNTDFGTFGLGYVGATLGGSFATGVDLADEGGIYFPLVSEEAISYTSSVILLSYGSEARRFIDWEMFDKVSVGTSFKLFSQGLSGANITDGMLNGFDMDFGALYKPMNWLSFGWNQSDALPASMGGKLTGGGVDHSLPTVTKLGMAFKVLGEDGYYTYSQPLLYLLDLDWRPTDSNYPILYRTGMEWWPSYYLALRFGLDQAIEGVDRAEVTTNLTAGVGISYNGFKFDYAYHRYSTLVENDTSYLSLSYAAPIEIAAPAPAPVPQPTTTEMKEYMKITPAIDKIITRDDKISIKGQLQYINEIGTLTINGASVPFDAQGTFEATYPLLLGKNKFEVTVIGSDGKVIASSKIRILRLTAFKDVKDTFWAKDAIETLATLGIVGGYPDNTFKPDKVINRAELTTLLVKSKNIGTPEASVSGFTDVPKKHWASFYIKNGVEMALVTGYPDKTFKPMKGLNRAEGVTIFSRFAELTIPETLEVGPFPDVPGRHWAAKSIMAARSAGLLMYLMDKPFGPTKEMSRAEAAEILSKTQYALTKITDLKDFDTY
jgi:hypothetical protein